MVKIQALLSTMLSIYLDPSDLFVEVLFKSARTTAEDFELPLVAPKGASTFKKTQGDYNYNCYCWKDLSSQFYLGW